MEPVREYFPTVDAVSDDIPDTARKYLQQASESMHTPAGAVMLAASAVDAMLKNKGYKKGSLSERIEKAAGDHLITVEMAKWAHQVRLDANDQRHADEDAVLPDQEAAKRVVAFASALGQFLFVLPSMVTKGLKDSGPVK